jgi:transposase
MKAPLFVRALTDAERQQLEAQLRSSDAFSVRRAQILLQSARGQTAKPIAENLGCSTQTVRNVLRAFHTEGLNCLNKQSNRPKSTKPTLDEDKGEQLQHLLHQSPRIFDKPTSVWTLALAAQVCCEQGLTSQVLSDETLRRALKRLNTNWKRAKHWISSPDPQYARKKET